MSPLRRPEDDWNSMVPPELGGVGGGPSGMTPYDQAAEGIPDDTGVAPAPDAMGGAQAPVEDAPIGLLSSMGTESTDDLTGAQLGELAGGDVDPGMTSPDESEFLQLQSALEDPNTPPEVRAQIEQQLAEVAKRQMLGGV